MRTVTKLVVASENIDEKVNEVLDTIETLGGIVQSIDFDGDHANDIVFYYALIVYHVK